MKKSYLKYNKNLAPYARALRTHLTDAESRLWLHIRRKQILDVQFYRQKPIGSFIVDFFAAQVQLVIELDGSQHFEQDYLIKDKRRDDYLTQLGLTVLRFDNGQVMHSLDGVLEEIYNTVQVRLKSPRRATPNPPAEAAAPFWKGGKSWRLPL